MKNNKKEVVRSGRQTCGSDTTGQVRPPGVRGKALAQEAAQHFPRAPQTWAARSGCQTCGVKLSAKPLPHGSADMASKCPMIYIKTFGCQMNIRDSEVITGLLLENGFEVLDSLEREADAVLLVTCSVRQHAEDKVWSEIGRFSKLAPKPVIGLIGCMAENYKDDAFKRMPGIDLVVGTNNIGEIPQLLKEIFDARRGTKGAGRKARDESQILAVGKAKRDEFV